MWLKDRFGCGEIEVLGVVRIRGKYDVECG